MNERGFSADEQFAKHLSTSGIRPRTNRVTVFRWRTEQHRLNPEKIAIIARGLDIEPEELWRPPSRRSLDAIAKGATDEQFEFAAEMVSAMMRRPRAL